MSKLKAVPTSDQPVAKFMGAAFDGLINLVSGMGTKRDKSSHSKWSYTGNPLDKTQAEVMYRESWAAGKAVDIPAKDMVRKWRSFDAIEGDQRKKLEETERRLKVRAAFLSALKWSRVYGGAAILMNVEDGLDPSQPLNVNAIREGSLKWLAVLDRYQISSTGVTTTDPSSPNYNLPAYYVVGGRMIHHTRVIRFVGTELPHDLSAQTDYWGDSLLVRIRQSINNADTVSASIASLVQEAGLDVIKIGGLVNLLCDPTGETDVLKRLTALNLGKSNWNAMLLDSAEEYEKKQGSFAGLKELIYDYLALVSGATDIPLTRLLGVSPGGLNATGESDLRNYYDRISADQEDYLRPRLEYLDQVLLRSAFGNMPADSSFTFDSLWQLSAKEQAEVDKLRGERDTIYSSIVPASSILAKVQSEGTYVLDDDLIDDTKEAEGGEFNEEDARLVSGEPTAAATPASTSQPLSATVLNGAQITSAKEIVQAVANGQLPRDAGIGLLMVGFNLGKEGAELMMGSAGSGFTPATEPTPGA